MSPEMWVMLKPAEAYSGLARLPVDDRKWLLLRRPLFVAFILGCTISLITSGRITARLAGPATLYWTFVPLSEIAALVALWWGRRQIVSLPRAVDLFFMSHGPWSLWLIGMAIMWSFFDPIRTYGGPNLIWLDGAGVAVMVWSGYIDYCFFQRIFGRSSTQAAGDVLLQRLISWSLILLIFGGGSLWEEIGL